MHLNIHHLRSTAISQSTQHLTTWKLSSVIPLFSRWRMPCRVRYVRTSTSSRSGPPSGIAQSCFHTQGARCKSRGFLVRIATAMRMPRKRNCTMWSSESAPGLNRNLPIPEVKISFWKKVLFCYTNNSLTITKGQEKLTCQCYCPHLQSCWECGSKDPLRQTATPGENTLKFLNLYKTHDSPSHHSHVCFPSYLAHLSDRVIKHSPSIVRSFSDKFDLPGSRWQSQLQWIQAHHLLCDLHKDWLARPTSVEM